MRESLYAKICAGSGALLLQHATNSDRPAVPFPTRSLVPPRTWCGARPVVAGSCTHRIRRHSFSAAVKVPLPSSSCNVSPSMRIGWLGAAPLSHKLV